MKIYKSITIILLLILVLLISITKITPVATDLDTHSHTIAQIDEEIASVMKLAAGATAASAAISLLPDDQCTPISEQFAELGTYFVVVLSALYLEKYLVTIIGYVSFCGMIPLACIIGGIGLFAQSQKLKILSLKFVIFAISLECVIPISVKTSEIIYNNYSQTIDQTVDSANELSIVDEDQTTVERFMSWIENAAGTIVEYVTGLLSRFIEAIAVMIVTSCLIPILVIIFFIFLMKILFNVDISTSDLRRLIPGKHI